jgi:hypothetical protein
MHTHQMIGRVERSRTLFRIGWLGFVVAAAGACSSPTAPTRPGLSLSVGQWSGTTSQGMSITFTVSPDETLTQIAIGYRVNGCSGSQTFTNLTVRTAPEVICASGSCPPGVTSYRAFNYASGIFGRGPATVVNGLFLPGDRAEGRASFWDYPGCGSEGPVTWTATRR